MKQNIRTGCISEIQSVMRTRAGFVLLQLNAKRRQSRLWPLNTKLTENWERGYQYVRAQGFQAKCNPVKYVPGMYGLVCNKIGLGR